MPPCVFTPHGLAIGRPWHAFMFRSYDVDSADSEQRNCMIVISDDDDGDDGHDDDGGGGDDDDDDEDEDDDMMMSFHLRARC